VIAGTGAHGSGGGNAGTPLAVAQTAVNARAESVATATAGAGGPVQIAVPPGRNASTVAEGPAESTYADGSRTAISFDAAGYPASINLSGEGTPDARYETVHNTRGLPEMIVYPEGNRIIFAYEPETAPFRARANPIRITRDPGPRGGDLLVSEMAYDHRYNLPSNAQRDLNGNTITVVLREDGRDIATVQYPRAGNHTFSHNSFGQIVGESTVEGIVSAFTYDSTTGYTTRRTLGGTLVTEFAYGGGRTYV
jgi:YD repeat-containing protein